MMLLPTILQGKNSMNWAMKTHEGGSKVIKPLATINGCNQATTKVVRKRMGLRAQRNNGDGGNIVQNGYKTSMSTKDNNNALKQ